VILILGVLLIALLNKYFVRYIMEVITTIVSFCTVFTTYELLRIFSISSASYKPFINPNYISLVPYFLVAFAISYFFLPLFIGLMKNLDIITVPGIHNHPSMLLRGPSARGGGIYFTLVFILLTFLIVGITSKLTGLYIGLILLGILSYVDDYQNTHPHSAFKIIENPLLRLLLLTSVVSIPVMSGIKFDTIINPLQHVLTGQFIYLANFNLISSILTIIWIVWFLNVLSWSNGVDGQFSGIVGIAFIVVALLSLRFKELTLFHRQLAILAIIGAGISFGTVSQMWHPSRIMWGFGAMSAGLVLAVLSFSSQSKIVTSILIILIPFLDALVTLLRRLLQGKNPLKGDRGHLHHILIAKGWSVSKIATFYWITTAVFGLIGLITAEKFTFQVGFALVGIVAFAIVLLNLSFMRSKNEGSIPRR
jgi:UDP-GlcNAc:undecaprenyl-phosphate GlcNAc-1-phosphate transferase